MTKEERLQDKLDFIRLEYSKLQEENKKLLVEKQELQEKFSLYIVGCSLPTRKEINLQAEKECNFIDIKSSKQINLHMYQGFMSCADWYAERMNL